MTVFTKKDEKIGDVVNSLNDNYTQEEFISKFIEMYPKDWGKIEKSYRDHERKTKPGKFHPMPKPEQFLKNSLNVWQKSNN